MNTPDPTQGRRQLRPTDVKRLNRDWRRRTSGRLGRLVESVTQPFNTGSIIRSDAAFGVEHLWLAGNATLPTHRNVAKTALGTERLLPWEHAGTATAAHYTSFNPGPAFTGRYQSHSNKVHISLSVYARYRRVSPGSRRGSGQRSGPYSPAQYAHRYYC